MEARLGAALDRARRRLRNVGQGLDRQRAAKLKICRALGGTPPEEFNYELFLDENGEKISKSKGNGLTIDEWLRYAPPESLAYYIYGKPKTAKRLYFDVIPKAVDEYLSYIDAYPKQNTAERMENPVWHMHSGSPAPEMAASYQANATVAPSSITFALLLEPRRRRRTRKRRISSGALSPSTRQAASPATHPMLDRLCGYAHRLLR